MKKTMSSSMKICKTCKKEYYGDISRKFCSLTCSYADKDRLEKIRKHFVLSRTGKKHSDETKKKIRNSKVWKHRDKQTKEKIRETLSGRKLTDCHKENISNSLKGKKYSFRVGNYTQEFKNGHAVAYEKILKEVQLLEKRGYTCVPVGHRVTPDIIAVKGDNIKITAVEVEYGKPNYPKYSKEIQQNYDDIIWILRNSILPKAVIFEGPDGCGKTHIAKAFAERHVEFNYFKLKKDAAFVKEIPADVLKLGHELEAEFFTSLIKQVDLHVAFDRQYPSEICYGRAFRKINEKYWKEIDLEHSKIGTKIIICIKNNKRKDSLFNEEQIKIVEKEYLRFANETYCDVLILNTEDENISEQLKKIDNFVYGFNHEKIV